LKKTIALESMGRKAVLRRSEKMELRRWRNRSVEDGWVWL
jgi:hypothetical protein